ncbi:MAG: sll1863 family stress response protein [Desulfobaccales bacterium]
MKKKKEEVQAMESRLDEMSKRISKLKERLGTATGEIRAELERRIDAATEGAEEQRQRLQQLKDTGLEKWDSLKDQAGKAWDGLEKSLQDLAAKLKK